MSNILNNVTDWFDHVVQVSLKSFGVLIGLLVTSILKVTLTTQKLSWWQSVLQVLTSYFLGLFSYFIVFPFSIYYALIIALVGDKIAAYVLSYDIKKLINTLINMRGKQ